MILTTTGNVEGKQVGEYLGVIAGEAIMGANLIKDLFANITDVLGGRSGAYERELANARQTALQELEQTAGDLGADAVLSIDLDYEVINNMLMVTASGTAVRFRR